MLNTTRFFRRARGYTLIEMLLVMGIIIMLVTLVLISVNSMLRASKMNRAVNMFTAAADEARTAALTIRRTTRIDVTSIDTIGAQTRLSVFGPGLNNNFEQYPLPDNASAATGSGGSGGSVDDDSAKAIKADWKWSNKQPIVTTDGTRCLKLYGATGGAGNYWYRGTRVDAINVSDYYEAIVFARIKILPGIARNNGTKMTVGLLCSIDDGNSKSIKKAYRLAISITPARASSRNESSEIVLERSNGGTGTPLADSTDGKAKSVFDKKPASGASPTALLVEGIWYRLMLSVKSYTPDDEKKDKGTPKSIIAGKIWSDGQLEPVLYTVGPCIDTNDPLSNGFGGFSIDNCDALVDDVLFDMRPARLVPAGIALQPLDPDMNYKPAEPSSRYAFPLMFRPDGTTSNFTVIKITDTSMGDARYVRIDQNTGRIRLAQALDEVKK